MKVKNVFDYAAFIALAWCLACVLALLSGCLYCSKCKLDPKCCVVPQACEHEELPDD